MGTENHFVRLLWLLCFLYTVGASHFRGGFITWAPVYNQQNQITVTWRFAWNRASVPCDQTTIDNNGLIGEHTICDMNTGTCFDAKTYCNDFDVVDNWSGGTFTTTFTATSTSFVLQYTSNAWIPLDNGGNGVWDLRSYVNLTPRPFGRHINTSPTTSIAPVVNVPPGTTKTIVIPTADTDGDYIRCRWATGESGSVSQPSTSVLSLDPLTCTITFTSSGTISIWGVAIYIEDFLTSTSTTSLSTVPLQFLIQVKALPPGCTTTKPTLIAPSPSRGSQIAIDAESLFTLDIHGMPTAANKPITNFATISPRGVTRSSLKSGQGSTKYISINWTPELSQEGPNIFCFSVSDECQSSEQWCVTLLVQVSCDPECINGGGCVLPNQCDCLVGYSGDYCQTVVCDPNCLNGGECIEPNECDCTSNYTGPICEQAICFPDCRNDGVCSAPDICDCTSDYIGDICEIRNAPSVNFDNAIYSIDEANGTLIMMLTNSGPMPGTVLLQTIDQSATENEDYVPINNETINFDAYQSKEASITILDDNRVEEDEDLFVEITGAAVGEGIDVVNVTIVDDDPSIVFVEARTNIIESTGTVQLYLVNSGSVTGTAYLTSSDLSTTENADYEPINHLAVTVEAGETHYTTINVLDDNLVEFEEKFMVTLTGDDVGIDGFKIMEIIIDDDDASINFVSSTSAIDETSGIVKLTLHNNGSADGTVCEYLTTFLQTEDISTKEDIDYEPKRNVPISVALGTTKEVSVRIYDDTAIETKESFVVVINGTDVGDRIHMVKVTISDDDLLKSPEELFDERVVNAIKEIDALVFDENISNEQLLTELEEISVETSLCVKR
ncbi:uncharacterized protein [Amphiura filiformis]|uniref:uncharacterized protein n=1 Tax=Amphiura filiformis TaxID=82378 RepID=UPI003B20E5F4